MKKASLRCFAFVLIWLTALAPPIGAVGYLFYDNLLAPRAGVEVAGPYDGFYWDAAQFQIAYARLENQVLLYQTGADRDGSTLTLRYQILQSKIRVMLGSTRMLETQPSLEHWQHDELVALDKTVKALSPDIEALPGDRSRADQIVAALNDHWDEVNDLAQSRRLLDVAERDAIARDFLAKRRYLFAGGVVLLLLSAAATALLIFNGLRRSKLIVQQHAAIAAEHEAARVARETSLAKDTFLGMISHELRTPLHAIVSSVELLGFHQQSEADRKVIRRLEAAARHLEVQMRDLTDYARLGAGKLVLHDERFDPRALIESIVDENLQAASAKHLTLTSGADGGTGLVESDPHRIRQIVGNLVTNAIRYTDTGSVRVVLSVQSGALAISVSDTGPGVDEAQIPLLFKEFTQLDGSRTRRFGGAGMGLAIVQGLVNLFGGTIRVASRMGEGTTFSVTIPVRLVEPPAPDGAARAGAQGGSRPRVLVIDDNPPVRESLGELLAHMECEAVAAGSADEALRWLDTERCDLVLVDLHMPEKDGYSFLAEFRERGGTNTGVPVIAVSAYAPDSAGQGASGPFFDMLSKPVHYDQLRDAVERARVVRREARQGA
ncbi:response regulator [Trinickia terrae]|uniref:Virulence sensor protein BvgS n=1 Tax=Trinickia terrae TaxID=2571161 RepID=A0A4V5PJS8_9BURK|nr:ATP-binding protein [Trinickia terrae]TKC92650.1 response regulator [Trinickia terrae]